MLLLAATTLIGGALPVRAQDDGAMSLYAAEFAACEDLDETALRAELNALAQSIFAANDGIALDAIVQRQWQLQDMDTAVDRAVDEAVVAVRRNEDLWNTFLSGWSPAKAESLARTVAETAFGSESFRQALEVLADGVGAELEQAIAARSAESVSVNLICLQQFIEQNYSDAVVAAFQRDIRGRADRLDLVNGEDLERGIMTVLSNHRRALGGVGVIIAAQLTRRLMQRMGRVLSRRVAGRVVGRLLGRAGAAIIPLAGWIIGGGLIVYDVIDSLDGALPQIQQSLQSAETEMLIQDEIVATLAPELQRELPQIARDLANDLYGEWLDFQRQHRQVLALAQENAAFAALIGDATDLAQTAGLLDAAMATLGAAGVDQAIASGAFAQMQAIGPVAADLLSATGSSEAVLAWEALAGPDLAQVVVLDLHRLRMPQELDRPTLDALLALDDADVIAKLALLDVPALDALLTLSRASLTELALRFSAEELSALGSLLIDQDPGQRSQLVSALLGNPRAMAVLAREGAGEAVLASRDMGAAIAFLDTPADGYSLARDSMSVASGAVSLRLFGAKYGGWTLAGLIGIPLLLLFALVYSLVALMARPFLGIYRLLTRSRR